MKEIKKIVFLGMILFFSFLFVSCGSEEKSGGSKVTLSYASWDAEQATGLRKVLDKFEEKNPDIKVEMDTTPWEQYWVKLESAATGKNLPDIVTMHSSESYKYMSQGVLMNLNDLVEEKKINLDNFTDGIADFYTFDNQLYAVPKDATVVGLWYNKKIFDDAGVSYPDNTWTWETFRQAAIDLTDESKNIYGFAADNSTEAGYYPFIYQNKGNVYVDNNSKSGMNSPEVQEAIEFYKNLVLIDGASPSIKDLQDTNKAGRFQAGTLAMIVEGNWQTAGFLKNDYMVENADVAVLPKGKVNATITNGLGWAASADTKHPEEVKKLMAFLASEEANQIQAETGASIPALKGFEDVWANSAKEFNLGVFSEMLEYGYPRPFNKNGLKAEKAETEAMNKILSGDTSVQGGTKQIAEEVDKILSSE